jgi:hypothetical protein
MEAVFSLIYNVPSEQQGCHLDCQAIMIRLPASIISLSAQDLQQHSRSIRRRGELERENRNLQAAYKLLSLSQKRILGSINNEGAFEEAG